MSTDVLEVARLGSRASESLFELTAPPGALPSAADFLIAEMERRFGGRVVRAEKPEEIAIEPEQYAPRAIFEPEWERYRDESGKLPFRVEVARLLWQSDNAKLRKKALRFLNCNKCGRSGLCSRYPEEHKFYIPNGCEVVFCKQCADEMRRALTFEYVRVILASIERLGGIPDGWVLARVSFTLRSDGSEITPERVKKFNACVRKVMRRVIGARKKTVRNLFTTFQMMWKSARAWGYVANDVTFGIVLPKKRRARNSFFTLAEVQRIISTGDFCVWPRAGTRTVLIKPEPQRTFYWIAAETGLRAGELCGLRVCDLDLQAGRLDVRQSVWRGRVQTPKTENAYRTLALSSELVEHLRDFVFKLIPNERGLLFATRNGTPWDANLLVKRRLHPLLSALGIASGGLHAFRHANASLMDRLKVPVKVRQERLGHSDPRMTLGVYTHVASEDDLRIASQLGKAISGGISCPVLPN
ncbi:MAG TPA: site-specific integrase [Candidatus Aquilonibacter sp.]|nr:site-specific integrase [Candidatus Aquilonibacter sp.]